MRTGRVGRRGVVNEHSRFSWLAGLALLAALPVAAGEDLGPGFVLQGEGGLVTAFALDPSSSSTLYAATARGLYKTTNAGASWRQIGAGLEDRTLLAVAVDPVSPSSLYAATNAGGVLRSRDGGAHWVEAGAVLAGRHVGAVAADPRGRDGVYAGADGGSLFHSGDGAVTWEEWRTPARVTISAIAPDPDGNRVVIGTNSEGVFWSDDGGASWRRPSGALSRGTVWCLTFDRASGALFAGTHDGLFRSDDRGATWTSSSRGMRSLNVLALAVHPSAPGTLYAGTAAAIYASTDGGLSWREIAPDLYVSALAIDPRSPSTLYAATHLGVIKSEDGGAKWKPLRLASGGNPVAASGYPRMSPSTR